MAFRVLASPFRSRLNLGIALGTTAYCAHTLIRPSRSQLLYCDSPPPSSLSSTTGKVSSQLNHEAKTHTSAGVYRQISSGSIIGLVAGLAVGTFSRTLTVLFGMLVLGVQYAASKGIHIIPYNRIQRYVKGINVRAALERNIAFKLAFGATFALAAFAPL